MAKGDIARKRAERIAQREKIGNLFLLEFVAAVVYCILVYIHMWSFGPSAVAARGWTSYAPYVALVLTALLVVVRIAAAQFAKSKLLEGAAYFTGIYAVLYIILNLHVNIGKQWQEVPWLSWLGLGNEWKGLQFTYAWIGIGLLICFVIYLFRYSRVGKTKKVKEGSKYTQAKEAIDAASASGAVEDVKSGGFWGKINLFSMLVKRKKG
ncbi:MAG: hypothetical protein LBL34_02125 [Clostridiales bacterium]|jgi:hypothetical protein|nr:hypothetical protein [Clostridiales bacterium]